MEGQLFSLRWALIAQVFSLFLLSIVVVVVVVVVVIVVMIVVTLSANSNGGLTHQCAMGTFCTGFGFLFVMLLSMLVVMDFV